MKPTVRLMNGEDVLKILSEQVPVGVCIMQGGRFCYINSFFSSATGYAADELVGKDSLEIVVPEDREMVRENTLKMLKGELLSPYQFRVICRDGSVIWVMATVKSIQYHGRRATLGNYMEITGRKLMEEAVKESEQRYKELANSVTDIFFAMDEHLRYTYWNKASEVLTGIRAEDALGKSLLEIFPDAPGMRRAEKVYLSVLRTQQPQTFVNEYDLDGRHCIFEISAYPSRGGISVFVKDVTERKQAQDKLRQSEENYRALFDSSVIGTIVLDVETMKVVMVNKAAAGMFGFSSVEEAIGLNPLDFIPPEDREEVLGIAERNISGHESQLVSEFRAVTKDGRRIWISAIGVRIMHGGRLAGLISFTDTTNRRQIEEALRQSKESYRTLAEQTLMGLVVLQDFRVVFANSAFAGISGYSIDELMSLPPQNVQAMVHPEDQTQVWQRFRDRLAGEATPSHYEYRGIRKNGSVCWLEMHATRIEYNGKPAIQGAIIDITSRKQAKEALEKSEERYRTLSENAGEAILVVQDDVVKFINPRGVELSGYSAEELVSRPFAKFIYPDDLHMVADRYIRRLRGEPVPQTYDLRIVRKDGDIRWGTLSAAPISWEDRPAVLCFMSDITERKQAEEALRQSEERYRTILEETGDGYFESDLGGNFTFVNDAQTRLLGYSREEIIGLNFRAFTPEEKVKSVFEAYNRVYKTGEPLINFPDEVIRKDGSHGFAETSAVPIRNHKGEIIGFRGVRCDITERKKMEETLRQSEERYRTILEEMEDSYFEVDLGGHLTYVNRSTCRNLGYSKEELIGMSYKSFTVEEDIESVLRVFAEVYQTGVPNKGFFWKVNRKDGTPGFAEASISLLREDKGEINGFRGMGRDITERRQAEEALRQSEERYRTILDAMQEGYYEVDIAGNFTFVNDAMSRILGYSRDELIGMNYKTYTPEEDHKRVFQAYNQVYGTGELLKWFPMPEIRKDGTRILAEDSVFPLLNERGEVIGFRGISRDVTERRKMEEALRQSEENYRALFDNSVVGTIVLDAETMKVVMANQAAAKIFGFGSVEEGLGQNPIDLIAPQHKDRVIDVITKELFEQDSRMTHEFRAITKDGREIWISATGAKTMHEGRLAGLVCFADVTEQKLQNEKLMLADRLASIGELAAGAAHELNNPLASVIGLSELLMERNTPDYIRRELAMIRDEARRAANVTNNLLTFARKYKPTRRPTQIHAIIEGVLKFRAYAHRSNSVEVERYFAADLPEISVDPFQMQQVFLNIIINAEYFMIETHNRGTLTITTERREGSVTVSFADDGPGIPPQNLGRIFDPFFTTKEAGKGTGLGLSICHGIVAEHGGQIYATSQPGKGATIFVELPTNGSNDAEVML